MRKEEMDMRERQSPSGSMQDHATRSSLLLRLSDPADVDAWADFSQRYGGLIRAVLSRAGVNAVDRDDVAQEVTLSIFRAMPNFRYDAEKGRFRAYLKTVVLRAAARNARKSAPTVGSGMPDPEVEDQLEEVWEREWRRHHVREALAVVSAELPDGERIVLERYVVAGAPAQQVAHESGWSVDRVYRVKWKLMQRLSEIITRRVEEEDR
jgi:RNA polymerase sigma-70 factor (ECF subfamily)